MDILRKKIEFITSDWDRLLLVLLFFALPFERIPSLNLFGVTWRISVFVGVAIIIRTLYLLYLKKISFRIITPYKVLALFVLWIFLLIPEAINYKRAIYGVFFDSYVIALAISISLIYKKKYLQPILLSLLSGAVFVSIFGIYQYFGDSFGLPIKYTGLREAYTGELFGFPRVHAASLEPLYFASYLLLPLCLAGAMVISGTSLYKIPRKAVVVIFSLYTLLLLLTLSRGGIYGFIATALLMIGIASYKKITKVKDIAIFVASIIVGFVLSFILINYLNHSALQSFTAKRLSLIHI